MRRILMEVTIALVWICAPAYASEHAQVVPIPQKAPEVSTKPNSEEALNILKAGNLRFAADKAIHPHANLLRMKQAGTESQGQHAFATILACSDSRVPVERIFDAGIMDLFVIRVAGNVCNGDQAGSIEYGLAHVNTPLLVVMGHTQCGAVTAVAQALQGKAHTLERNIPGMIAGIQPAVKRVMQGEEGTNGPNLVEKSIEENVWQAIENLFMNSPRTRELVSADKVRVVGAVYDVGTGRVRWLSESKVYRLLGRTESDPRRALNAFADGHDDAHAPAPAKAAAHAAPIHDDHAAPPKAAAAAHGDAKHASHAEAAHGDGHDAHAAPAKGGHGETADAHAAPKNEQASKAPAAAKKDPHAKSADAKKASDSHDSHGKEADGHGKESAEKKDDEHAEDSEHGEGKAEAAEGAPAKTKPWMLIGVAGGIAVAGVVLLLLGMKSAKAAPAGDGHGADGHAAPEAQPHSAPAH